jgi:uncharacterized protein (TIGR03382 family)
MMLLAIAAQLAIVQVDPSMVQSTPHDQAVERADNRLSRTIFLNRCAGGCTINQGQDDAGNNSSSILQTGQAHFTEWQYGDDAWNQLVACVKDTYGDFNINITDQRPTSGVYWMEIVAGTSGQAGFPPEFGILGVAPWDGNCPGGFLDNAITFTFANDPNGSSNINFLCHVAAQESAHAFGLDHEALDGEAMSYLNFDGAIQSHFIDQDGPCGAQTAGDQGCSCPNVPTQNSYQEIMGFFGPRCMEDADCVADHGDGFLCRDGECVAGPGAPMGLGTACEDPSDCASGTCTQSSNDGNFCTIECDPSSNDCPAGFDCLPQGSGGVCWPGGGGGGCCSAGGGAPTPVIMLGFVVGAIVMRRRRAR